MTGAVHTVEAIRPQARAASGASQAIAAHWPEYLMEAAELAVFMISACVFAVVLEHPASPVHRALPSGFVRRAAMGTAMGLTAIAIFYSGWGRQSGAHMNPAITLTFLRLKKIAGWDASFYVVAQFIGGLAGVFAANLTLHDLVAVPAVRYAVTSPGRFGVPAAFVAEVVIAFILLTVVLNVSNNSKLAHFTGLIAGILICAYITLESPISGMSMNPARSFGSAFFARVLESLWIYFVAPPIGFLLAAELYVRRRGLHAVWCAKFHHDQSHRCIFRCGYMQQSMTAAQGR
jgi:aquaporin Z